MEEKMEEMMEEKVEEKTEEHTEENMTMADLSEELEASLEAAQETAQEAEEMDPVWAALTEYMNEKTVLTVKVGGVVNAGVIAYVEGIRGFIPASRLSLEHVEDLNEWLHKKIKAAQRGSQRRSGEKTGICHGTDSGRGRHGRRCGDPQRLRRFCPPGQRSVRTGPRIPDL